MRLVSQFYASQAGTVFAQLLAASVTDNEAGAFFRTFLLAGRRRRQASCGSARRGEVEQDIDVEVAQDVLFGPLIFRLRSGHAPLTQAKAGEIADAALRGLLTAKGRRRGAARTR